MTKGFQRRDAGGPRGGPFSDEQLAIIEAHERFFAGDRSNNDLVFLYSKRLKPGRCYGWQFLLDMTRRIEAFNAKHSTYGAPWGTWPFGSADIEKIVAWRERNPAAA